MTYRSGDQSAEQQLAAAAARVMERCDDISSCTDRPGEITRLFCTPAMRAVHDRLRSLMEPMGLQCRTDAAGNLIGRWAGRQSFSDNTSSSISLPPASETKLLLIGSHLDTVVNAGRYDGLLGVVIGLALVELVIEREAKLPFAIEIIGFSEEEGVRFSTPYIGSRALVGDLPPSLLSLQDTSDITLADALRCFDCAPERLDDAQYSSDQVIAFVEPHIEQGPILEHEELAVGVVTGIAGQTRGCFRYSGRSGHAGTVPMTARQDALAAGAQLILAVEAIGRAQPGLVATVGQIDVSPNTSNVIAGEIQLRLDVRHIDDQVRESAVCQIVNEATRIANDRNIQFEVVWLNHHGGVQFDPEWVNLMEVAVQDSGRRVLRLHSGAGHDAVVMSRRFNTAMLFLRCAGGVSHHPEEAVTASDVAVALDVLYRFIMKVADQNCSTPSA